MLVGQWVKFDSEQWFRKVSVRVGPNGKGLTIRGQIMFSAAPMDDPPAQVDDLGEIRLPHRLE